MKKYLMLLGFISACALASAQIVSMSERSYKNGLQGDFLLGFNFVSSTVRTIQGSSKVDLKYSSGLNSYGLSTNLSYSSVDNTKNINDGSFGFIYNYKVPDRIVIAEGFAQVAYNTLQRLDSRILAGGGPRFKIKENKYLECTLVAYTVYMSEKYSGETGPGTLNRSFRFSSMFTLKYKISDNAQLVHNTYYEPNFSNTSDYRIWSETSLSIKIIDHFAFNTAFKMDYKSIAPEGVNNLFYSVINTLSYSF